VRVQDESDEGRGEEGRREGGEVCYDLLEYLRKKGLWLYDCDFFIFIFFLFFFRFCTMAMAMAMGSLWRFISTFFLFIFFLKIVFFFFFFLFFRDFLFGAIVLLFILWDFLFYLQWAALLKGKEILEFFMKHLDYLTAFIVLRNLSFDILLCIAVRVDMMHLHTRFFFLCFYRYRMIV
jgi:hypothetical protein